MTISPHAVPLPRHTNAQWREAIAGAATDIARNMLGFTGARVDDAVPVSTTNGMVGAHIPMVGHPSYELILLASRRGCESLATAVLGMSVDGLPASVVADAIGECVNMLAGGVKRRLQSAGGDLELGLPVFVNGSVEPTDRLSVVAFPLILGPIETFVVLVGPR